MTELPRRSPEDIRAVLAAVMARDLGVYTIAQLTSDVTYEQLKRIGDRHLTEEAQRSALAELVGAITNLDTSARWGQGKTAASDGQRFSLPRRVLLFGGCPRGVAPRWRGQYPYENRRRCFDYRDI